MSAPSVRIGLLPLKLLDMFKIIRILFLLFIISSCSITKNVSETIYITEEPKIIIDSLVNTDSNYTEWYFANNCYSAAFMLEDGKHIIKVIPSVPILIKDIKFK